MQDGEDSDDEGTVGSAWRTPCGALYICYRYVYLARKDGAAAAWGELPPSHNSLARMVASDIRGLPEAFQDLHLCRGCALIPWNILASDLVISDLPSFRVPCNSILAFLVSALLSNACFPIPPCMARGCGLTDASRDDTCLSGKPGGQVCGAPLFRSCDMLLSAHLSLPLSVTADARPSSTILVNSVRPGSIELRWHEPHTLPNGHLRVEVLHAYCQSCGAAVGWRFAEVPGWEQEMADAHNSYRLWGRYGILSAATQRRTP